MGLGNVKVTVGDAWEPVRSTAHNALAQVMSVVSPAADQGRNTPMPARQMPTNHVAIAIVAELLARAKTDESHAIAKPARSSFLADACRAT